MNIIEVKNLTKTYNNQIGRNKIVALNDISFNLEKGQILGVIGPNGSGKTTLFKTILNFIPPTSGSIILFENQYKGFSLKTKIGFLYERINFYPELTAYEILSFYANLYNISKKEISTKIDYLLNLVGLYNFKNNRIDNFSKGMVQRLGIAMTLINDSELLIFDELVSGLDPYGALKICEIVQKLIENGKTIIFSSHVLSHIEELCTHILLLFKGKIIKHGNLKDFLCDKNKYRIDIKINNNSDVEKAMSALTNAGFEIEGSAYTDEDLEKIFINTINELK